MTKEEILAKHIGAGAYFNENIEPVLKAMQEYAEQEKKKEAIEFVVWASDNYWIREPFPRNDTGKIMWALYEEGKPDVLLTTDQLYSKFKDK